jgi:hypothetical protein
MLRGCEQLSTTSVRLYLWRQRMRVPAVITPARMSASVVNGLIVEPGGKALSNASFGFTTASTRPVCGSMITIAPSRFPSPAVAIAWSRVSSRTCNISLGGGSRESTKQEPTKSTMAATVVLYLLIVAVQKRVHHGPSLWSVRRRSRHAGIIRGPVILDYEIGNAGGSG